MEIHVAGERVSVPVAREVVLESASESKGREVKLELALTWSMPEPPDIADDAVAPASVESAGTVEIAPCGRDEPKEPAHVVVQDRQFEVEPLRVARGWVRRESLFDRLGDAAAGGVVVVCAPAGSGKTVLLRSWVEAAGLRDRVGWVSVERGERDAQRFWLSVIDALAAAVAGGGAGRSGAELPRRGGRRAAAGGARVARASRPCW